MGRRAAAGTRASASRIGKIAYTTPMCKHPNETTGLNVRAARRPTRAHAAVGFSWAAVPPCNRNDSLKGADDEQAGPASGERLQPDGLRQVRSDRRVQHRQRAGHDVAVSARL